MASLLALLSWLFPEAQALAPLGTRGLRDGKGKVDDMVVYGAHSRRKGLGFEVCVRLRHRLPGARAFAQHCAGPGLRPALPELVC